MRYAHSIERVQRNLVVHSLIGELHLALATARLINSSCGASDAANSAQLSALGGWSVALLISG